MPALPSIVHTFDYSQDTGQLESIWFFFIRYVFYPIFKDWVKRQGGVLVSNIIGAVFQAFIKGSQTIYRGCRGRVRRADEEEARKPTFFLREGTLSRQCLSVQHESEKAYGTIVSEWITGKQSMDQPKLRIPRLHLFGLYRWRHNQFRGRLGALR